MSALDPKLTAYLMDHQQAYLEELKAWIAIPSMSANPEYAPEVRRCCDRLVERMNGIGLAAKVLETDGNPLAYGEWLGAPGKPTVIIYGHYDVQPVDPVELWETPPFEGTVRDGKIYGRGSVDDKGQVLMHLAALEAHLKTHGALPINVRVIIEGEEEIGSPNFEKALARYRDLFSADLAIISDTAVYSEDVPSITTSIRGLVHWDLTVHGPTSDLHSGYYGGLVRNPIEALANIISALKDANGRVTVPGFYEGVSELEPARANELRALEFDEVLESSQLGVSELWGEDGRFPLERMWFRPTLECNGIWGGYQGPGHKTIIPSWASAKLSARLVGFQEPTRVREIITKFIKQIAPSGVHVAIEDSGIVRAVVIDRDHPAIAAASRAMRSGFGKEPVFIGTGGSIGPVASFDRILKLPQVMVGVGLPDDCIHAPNEKFNLAQFFGGIATMAELYVELSQMAR